MNTSWPKVQLGKILIERREKPDPECMERGDFRIVSKIRFNLGEVELRRESETKTKMILVRPGDLLLSGINAAKGAIAIYGHDNPAPAAATIHYSAYHVVPDRADIKYLWWYLRSKSFHDILFKSLLDGIKSELKPSRFLPIEIPLPHLSEQRRIVTQIAELSVRVKELQKLQRHVLEDVEVLCRSLISQDAHAVLTPLREMVALRSSDVIAQREEVYQFAGVYCFGRGVFRTYKKMGADFAYTRLTRLRTNDFTYPKLMAWEGAFGIVPPECNGCVVSTEFPVFEIIDNRILPEVLDTYFKTPSVWPQISGESKGTNVRRRRLHPQDFLNYKIPLPSPATQELLRIVKVKVNAIKSIQTEDASELDALLPSILNRAFKGELWEALER